jgi:hypothetical protein
MSNRTGQRSTRKSDSPGKSPAPDDIRAAREASGLTARKAAALVHRSQDWWEAIEKGERQMDATAWEHFLLLAMPEDAAGAHLKLLRQRAREALERIDRN